MILPIGLMKKLSMSIMKKNKNKNNNDNKKENNNKNEKENNDNKNENKSNPTIQSKTVTFNESYVKKVIDKISFLKNNEKFPGRDYDKLIKGLNNIIDENEYDDSAADTFNNLIAKFLYTSAYSKFDSNFFDTTIKKLLQDIGYTSLNLKPGDDINSYKLYFERANKVEEDGISNTIKKNILTTNDYYIH